MNLKEMYSLVGNYDDVMGRLLTEERVVKYLGKFSSNSSDFDNLVAAYDTKDYKNLFIASHTIKGVAANLGLSKLQKAMSDLCETVRHGDPETDISSLMEAAKESYIFTVEKIKETL